jgi:hypothetical protein
MRHLSVDKRGYVVPWFVDWVDGEPEFRAMDGAKFRRAIKEKLCWTCGGKLGVNVCFVAGPMCGINRTSSEPPNHLECARYSARNCPFLSNPHMVRREDDLINNGMTSECVAGVGLMRNPGVAMLWITRVYDVFRVPNGNGVLIQMGEPESVEWYACGRAATRAEVLESIDTGLPNLETLARQQAGAMEALDRAKKRFDKWIPA